MAATDFNAGPVSVREIETLVVIALRHLPEADEDALSCLAMQSPDPSTLQLFQHGLFQARNLALN